MIPMGGGTELRVERAGCNGGCKNYLRDTPPVISEIPILCITLSQAAGVRHAWEPAPGRVVGGTEPGPDVLELPKGALEPTSPISVPHFRWGFDS
jgi:hypothetical protein